MSVYPELLDALRDECKRTYDAHDLQLDLMCKYLNENWDEWETAAERWSDPDVVWTALRNYIWVNWAGGDTAQAVTDRIKARVEKS